MHSRSSRPGGPDGRSWRCKDPSGGCAPPPMVPSSCLPPTGFPQAGSARAAEGGPVPGFRYQAAPAQSKSPCKSSSLCLPPPCSGDTHRQLGGIKIAPRRKVPSPWAGVALERILCVVRCDQCTARRSQERRSRRVDAGLCKRNRRELVPRERVV